jgi:hypothetical protein
MSTVAVPARDAAGRPLPKGAYLLEIVASSEELERVRAVRPIVLR